MPLPVQDGFQRGPEVFADGKDQMSRCVHAEPWRLPENFRFGKGGVGRNRLIDGNSGWA
jgi:hypothetical protein